MTNSTNLDNIEHDKLALDQEEVIELFEEYQSIQTKEIAHLKQYSGDDGLASLSTLISTHSDAVQYLGIGLDYPNKKQINISTSHKLLSSYGNFVEGSFIILMPIIDQFIHKYSDDELNEKDYLTTLENDINISKIPESLATNFVSLYLTQKTLHSLKKIEKNLNTQSEKENNNMIDKDSPLFTLKNKIIQTESDVNIISNTVINKIKELNYIINYTNKRKPAKNNINDYKNFVLKKTPNNIKNYKILITNEEDNKTNFIISQITPYIEPILNYEEYKELNIPIDDIISTINETIRKQEIFLLLKNNNIKNITKENITPSTFMITKIACHPKPLDEGSRDRHIKRVAEFPASALNFDSEAMASLHEIKLTLNIENYLSYIKDEDIARWEYHADMKLTEAVAWMAINVKSDLLEKILNVKPSNLNSFKFGELTETDLPLNKTLNPVELYIDPTWFYRSRTAFLGASGSGKSNLIKQIIMGIKKATFKDKHKLGMLILDPQGEYSQENKQGAAIADEINKISTEYEKPNSAIVYSFNKNKKNNYSQFLGINAFLEPKKAISLFKVIDSKDNTSPADYKTNLFNANLTSPIDLIEDFRREISKLIIEARKTIFQNILVLDKNQDEINQLDLNINSIKLNTKYYKKTKDNIKNTYTHLKNSISIITTIKNNNLNILNEQEILTLNNTINLSIPTQIISKFQKQWEAILMWWTAIAQGGFNISNNAIEEDFLNLEIWQDFFKVINYYQFSFSISKTNNLDSLLKNNIISKKDFKLNLYEKLVTIFKTYKKIDWVDKKPKQFDFNKILNHYSETEIIATTDFAFTIKGTGPSILSSLLPYHGIGFYDIESSIIQEVINEEKIVIVNMKASEANSSNNIKKEFSQRLCEQLFTHLSDKFNTNTESIQNTITIKENNIIKKEQQNEEYNVLVLFEEAQEVMSKNDDNIFKKIALMGRKLGIGTLFATQSPSNIDPELFRQANMMFIMSLDSSGEMSFLCNQQEALTPIQDKVMAWKKKGLGHWWRKGAPIIPFKANKFETVTKKELQDITTSLKIEDNNASNN